MLKKRNPRNPVKKWRRMMLTHLIQQFWKLDLKPFLRIMKSGLKRDHLESLQECSSLKYLAERHR
jgi:hypothetical protein